MNNKKYRLYLLLISVLLFAVSLMFNTFAAEHLVSDFLLLIVPFFYLMAMLTSFLTSKFNKKRPEKSLTFYLAFSGLKLFLFLAILIVYGILNRSDAAPFFISFLIFYFIYTFMDLRWGQYAQ